MEVVGDEGSHFCPNPDDGQAQHFIAFKTGERARASKKKKKKEPAWGEGTGWLTT